MNAAGQPGVGRPTAARIPRQRSGPSPSPSPSPSPRIEVLVAVGTDTHPFDRLLGWLEQWHAEVAGQVDMVIQHGRSRPPGIPGAVPFLGHAELQQAMSRATLVVCHGGPATILEARRHGHLPLVVPRDPTHGEHVDNHQQLFARRLAADGMVELCETRAALVRALSTGIAEPTAFAIATNQDLHEARLAAVSRVGQIVEDLVASSNPRVGLPWRHR